MDAIMDASARVRPSPAAQARATLLDGLALEERRLVIGGISTALIECGQGPPLLLLHGGIECGGAYWAPVIAALAQTWRLIIPDVPGLGESAPVKRLDAQAFSNWFVAVLQQTCRDKPVLVAHSLLGSMSARFATQNQGVLKQLVLYGAPGAGPYRVPLRLQMVAMLFTLRPSEANAERFDRWAFADYDRVRREHGAWLAAFSTYSRLRACTPHVGRTMSQLISGCTKQIADIDLRRIDVPTSLLWGRQDRFVPLQLGERASARLGWPLDVVENAGHVPHIEQIAAFLRVLRARLERPAAKDPLE